MQPEPQSTSEPKKVDLNKANVQEAIDQGKVIIKEGKSKADAARAIYALLRNEDKDVIVAAFVAGATLTEKGALTYWYNCPARVVPRRIHGTEAATGRKAGKRIAEGGGTAAKAGGTLNGPSSK